jgi:hypothetical protein
MINFEFCIIIRILAVFGIKDKFFSTILKCIKRFFVSLLEENLSWRPYLLHQ